MTTEKMVNYTAEQTAEAVRSYQAGATVESIAASMGKTVRSVVAKLSREKVYVPKARAVGSRVTKAAMVGRLAALIGVEAKELASLEKATHEALELLLAKARGDELLVE